MYNYYYYHQGRVDIKWGISSASGEEEGKHNKVSDFLERNLDD